MTFKYNYFFAGSICFFLFRWYFYDFETDQILNSVFLSIFFGLFIASFGSNRKVFKEITLALKADEVLERTFYAKCKVDGVKLNSGNLFLTDKRLVFINQKRETIFDITFSEIKNIQQIQETVFSGSAIEIKTAKHTMFINVYSFQKSLFEQLNKS